MFDTLLKFLRTSDFAPHGYCLLWQPELVWTHVVADSLIAAAYFTIPVALIYFVRKRRDIVFSRIFWLFALFITACGATHVMAIWTLWRADYGIEALVKVVTAIASVGTAIILWPLIPRALALPSQDSLRGANEELGRRIEERDVALSELRAEIAERKRAEAALLQSQKMDAMGQLTGGIAHDFNNLLQAVSGNLELIARSPAEVARVERWAGNALQAAQRGSTLTSQLLAFSRVQQLELRQVPVAPLIEAMLGLLGRTLGPNIALATELDGVDAVVLTDRVQLELAILNLAINARDAMPDGGTLRIVTALRQGEPSGDGDKIEISVTDTGTGMSAEVAEHAFEPFYTTKPPGKGTGLGLSMVYGMARQSGGTVRIESEPGAGTTVTIALNRVRAALVDAESDGRDLRAEAVVENCSRATILVVDDDEVVRSSIGDALRSMGHDVIEAIDGTGALAVLDRRTPDLVILDFAMPGINGAEVAKWIRRRHPDLPILFASGYADTRALAEAVGGEMPILRKPFTMVQLQQKVGTTLAKAA